MSTPDSAVAIHSRVEVEKTIEVAGTNSAWTQTDEWVDDMDGMVFLFTTMSCDGKAVFLNKIMRSVLSQEVMGKVILAITRQSDDQVLPETLIQPEEGQTSRPGHRAEEAAKAETTANEDTSNSVKDEKCSDGGYTGCSSLKFEHVDTDVDSISSAITAQPGHDQSPVDSRLEIDLAIDADTTPVSVPIKNNSNGGESVSTSRPAGSPPRDSIAGDDHPHGSIETKLDAPLKHVCEWCGKPFKANYLLIDHMSTHTMIKRHECAACGKTFANGANLRRHQRIHDGVRPYVCHVCSRAFGVRQHLADHERIHTREKPFSCSICGKAFRQKCDLNKHTGDVLLYMKYVDCFVFALIFCNLKVKCGYIYGPDICLVYCRPTIKPFIIAYFYFDWKLNIQK